MAADRIKDELLDAREWQIFWETFRDLVQTVITGLTLAASVVTSAALAALVFAASEDNRVGALTIYNWFRWALIFIIVANVIAIPFHMKTRKWRTEVARLERAEEIAQRERVDELARRERPEQRVRLLWPWQR